MVHFPYNNNNPHKHIYHSQNSNINPQYTAYGGLIDAFTTLTIRSLISSRWPACSCFWSLRRSPSAGWYSPYWSSTKQSFRRRQSGCRRRCPRSRRWDRCWSSRAVGLMRGGPRCSEGWGSRNCRRRRGCSGRDCWGSSRSLRPGNSLARSSGRRCSGSGLRSLCRWSCRGDRWRRHSVRGRRCELLMQVWWQGKQVEYSEKDSFMHGIASEINVMCMRTWEGDEVGVVEADGGELGLEDV